MLTQLKGCRIALSLVGVFVLSACSTLHVRVDPQSDRPRLSRCESESAALESALASARKSLPKAARGDASALGAYNDAVRQIVLLARKEGFKPTAAGLRIPGSGETQLDPSLAADVNLADAVKVRGLISRVRLEGAGVPCVLSYPQGSSLFKGQPGIPPVGLALPATATVTFPNGRPTLVFHDVFKSREATMSGHSVKLAADFSAPLALLISRSGNRSLDLRALLFPRSKLDRAGLFQLQPYDPNRIPVVFVHGLLARPETWARAANELMADPEIRKRYQFWFFLYPTGLPVWKSTTILRGELDRFHSILKRDRRRTPHDIVLVGHSMGGLISSLLVREAGEKLWNQFFESRFDDLQLSAPAMATVRELIFFPSRKDISRVVFIATPHRGSRLAVNPVATVISRLILLPRLIESHDRQQLVRAVRADFRNLFAKPTNSIRFLEANSPLIRAIQELPLAREIPYHSIIGDRGRGDTPHSSDGVVPYWSSHLPNAVSEKIVPTDHGAHESPEAAAELRRILLKAL